MHWEREQLRLYRVPPRMLQLETRENKGQPLHQQLVWLQTSHLLPQCVQGQNKLQAEGTLDHAGAPQHDGAD